MVEAVKDYWAIIVAALGFVVWLLRLEARSFANTKDLEKLEKRLAVQRTEDMASRQRDWDQMSETLREMRADIKTLLQRDK